MLTSDASASGRQPRLEPYIAEVPYLSASRPSWYIFVQSRTSLQQNNFGPVRVDPLSSDLMLPTWAQAEKGPKDRLGG